LHNFSLMYVVSSDRELLPVKSSLKVSSPTESVGKVKLTPNSNVASSVGRRS
jgi:hypothetical protein